MRSFGAHRDKVTDTLCDNTTLFSEHHISISRPKMRIPLIGDVPLRHWTIGSLNPETRRHIPEQRNRLLHSCEDLSSDTQDALQGTV